MEAHFRFHLLQRSRFEVTSAHPVFEGSEHVLDRSSPDAHRIGHALQPILHRLDDVLVFPSFDAPFLAGRALCLERAGGAGIGPVGVDRQAVLD